MGSKSVDEVLDAAAAGVHYSALRLEELDLQGSMSGQEQPTTSGLENGHREPFVIGVAGGASSGKSTVCKMIIDQLRDQRVVVVTQESFYYGLSDEELVHVHDYNFDHPDAFDTKLLLSCMENLKHGKAADIPNYNFKTYKGVARARKVKLPLLPPGGANPGGDHPHRPPLAATSRRRHVRADAYPHACLGPLRSGRRRRLSPGSAAATPSWCRSGLPASTPMSPQPDRGSPPPDPSGSSLPDAGSTTVHRFASRSGRCRPGWSVSAVGLLWPPLSAATAAGLRSRRLYMRPRLLLDLSSSSLPSSDLAATGLDPTAYTSGRRRLLS